MIDSVEIMPKVTIILGQPVLSLELLPEEGSVVLRLGATAEASAITARMFPTATIIDVEPGQVVDASARIHLTHFTVTLNSEFQIESYEIDGVLAGGSEVRLRVNKDGAFEVSGHVFRKGKADMAVSISSEGRLMKIGIWDGKGYRDIEIQDKEQLGAEAMEFAELLDSVANEFFYVDYGVIAKEIRLTPEVATLLKKLVSQGAFQQSIAY